MARLPQPGGDSGQWGDLLNDYLSVSHNADGTVKTGAVSNASIQDGAINVAKIATNGAPASGQSLTYNGTDLAWSTVSGSGTVPDATASTKGIIQLTGDLAGTAASPTVPGLASKENTIASGTTAQYYRGDKSWQALNKATVGLANVDNTADVSKPISTATQTALDAKEGAIAAGTTGQYYRGDKSWHTLNKAAVGLANVDNTADTDKPVSGAVQTALDAKAASSHTHNASAIDAGTLAAARLPQATAGAIGAIQLTGDLAGTALSPTVPGLASKENSIAAGTTGQYYRGDKSWQTLDKSAVGLANLDNTSDANKPISSATQTALNAKANSSHTHAASDIASGTIATARLPISSTSAAGVAQLATSAEVVTGTDTAKVVTPSGVKAALDAVHYPIVFVDKLADLAPGTPVDTLVVVRAA